MPIHEQLWRVGKVSCAGGQRRGAAVRKRAAIVIAARIVIHDAVGQRDLDMDGPTHDTPYDELLTTVQLFKHAVVRGAIARRMQSPLLLTRQLLSVPW